MEYDDSRDTATRLCDLKLNMQEEEESCCCWIFPLSLPDIWGKNKQGGGETSLGFEKSNRLEFDKKVYIPVTFAYGSAIFL